MVKWVNECMISGTISGRVEDIADVYADGDFLMTLRSPLSTSTATLPDNTRLLAVRATNTGAGYGFIIKLSNGFVTDTHWRCSNTYNNNWNKLSLNDDEWQPARVLSWPPYWTPHGLDPAEFIWAERYTPVVYCRGWPSKYYRPNST